MRSLADEWREVPECSPRNSDEMIEQSDRALVVDALGMDEGDVIEVLRNCRAPDFWKVWLRDKTQLILRVEHDADLRGDHYVDTSRAMVVES